MLWSVIALVERYGLMYNTDPDEENVPTSIILKLYLTGSDPLGPTPPDTPPVTEAYLIFSDRPDKSHFEAFGDHAIIQAFYPHEYFDRFWMIMRQEQAVSIFYMVEDHDALRSLSLHTAQYFPQETAREELAKRSTVG
jgi:hypothetical protein